MPEISSIGRLGLVASAPIYWLFTRSEEPLGVLTDANSRPSLRLVRMQAETLKAILRKALDVPPTQEPQRKRFVCWHKEPKQHALGGLNFRWEGFQAPTESMFSGWYTGKRPLSGDVQSGGSQYNVNTVAQIAVGIATDRLLGEIAKAGDGAVLNALLIAAGDRRTWLIDWVFYAADRKQRPVPFEESEKARPLLARLDALARDWIDPINRLRDAVGSKRLADYVPYADTAESVERIRIKHALDSISDADEQLWRFIAAPFMGGVRVDPSRVRDVLLDALSQRTFDRKLLGECRLLFKYLRDKTSLESYQAANLTLRLLAALTPQVTHIPAQTVNAAGRLMADAHIAAVDERPLELCWADGVFFGRNAHDMPATAGFNGVSADIISTIAERMNIEPDSVVSRLREWWDDFQAAKELALKLGDAELWLPPPPYYVFMGDLPDAARQSIRADVPGARIAFISVASNGEVADDDSRGEEHELEAELERLLTDLRAAGCEFPETHRVWNAS